MRSFQIYTVFSRNFKKILRISFFSKAALPITIIPMKKTQKIKHEKTPKQRAPYQKSASHKTPASDSPTKTVSLLHTVSYHNPVLCPFLFYDHSVLPDRLSTDQLCLRILSQRCRTSCCKIRYVCICRSYSGSYDAGKLRSGNRRYAIL